MKKGSCFLASLLTFGLSGFETFAGESKTIVPSHEKKKVQEESVKGPKKSVGIRSVKALGHVDLAKEFAAMKGRSFRARKIVVAPKGVVAVHEHRSRPGIAYILEGEIYEHRGGKSFLRKAGDYSFEKTGVVHWWENRSDKEASALVIDIIENKPEHTH